LPEQIEDGKSGLLVPPGNSQALAEAVIHLLENPQRARQYGESLHERYQTQFSWSNVASRLEEILMAISPQPKDLQ